MPHSPASKKLPPLPAFPKPGPGLYIHIPFCASRCPYCDFCSSVQPDKAFYTRYVQALIHEARMYGEQTPWRENPFASLYIGGGTPSLLPPELLEQLVNGLGEALSIAPKAEITAEANCGDITLPWLRKLEEAGITRLSIGLQSFADAELRWLGRRHDARQAHQALDLAREHGPPILSADLMFGLPDQPLGSLEKSLDLTEEHDIDHLSLYQLTIHPNTAFGQSRIEAADEKTQEKAFLRADSLLGDRGWLHYEVSNYARSPERISNHNARYWLRIPYLGLGASAHSFDGARRWWNTEDIAGYEGSLAAESKQAAAVALATENGPGAGNNPGAGNGPGTGNGPGAGNGPRAGIEELTSHQAWLEELQLGLRTTWGISLDRVHRPSAQTLTEAGLCIIDDRSCQPSRLRPSSRGLLMADSLALNLVGDNH